MAETSLTLRSGRAAPGGLEKAAILLLTLGPDVAASVFRHLNEQEVRQLRTELLREAVEAAVGSAENAVKSSIGPQDQSRLADEYLTNLDKTSSTGAIS